MLQNILIILIRYFSLFAIIVFKVYYSSINPKWIFVKPQYENEYVNFKFIVICRLAIKDETIRKLEEIRSLVIERKRVILIVYGVKNLIFLINELSTY